jgi:hypothetical protein
MKTIKVKAHKRNGRSVRSHGRVKKENRLKRKGLDLVASLEMSNQSPGAYSSLGEALKGARALEKFKFTPGVGDQSLSSGAKTTFYKKGYSQILNTLKNKEGGYKKQYLKSNFPN